jgi:hypothetical protein
MSNSGGYQRGYQIEDLTAREYATLAWLADHGYDAGILRAAGVEEEFDDGRVRLGRIPEHKAWEINERIEEDPDAFLASNGSRSLGDKLLKFVGSIV